MLMESEFVQFPDYSDLEAFVEQHGVARLYGRTLGQFTNEISAACHLDTPYTFVSNDLYELRLDNDAYALKNLSEEYRANPPAEETEE